MFDEVLKLLRDAQAGWSEWRAGGSPMTLVIAGLKALDYVVHKAIELVGHPAAHPFQATFDDPGAALDAVIQDLEGQQAAGGLAAPNWLQLAFLLLDILRKVLEPKAAE